VTLSKIETGKLYASVHFSIGFPFIYSFHLLLHYKSDYCDRLQNLHSNISVIFTRIKYI
jgi:hypothetical protein